MKLFPWRIILNAITIAAFLAVVAPGCGGGSDSDDSDDKQPVGDAVLGVEGNIGTTLDGTDVNADYTGGTATAQSVHKINPEEGGYACITSLSVTTEKADGSCLLEMEFMPWGGDGLRLTSASFYARRAVADGGAECEGWATGDSGEEVWDYQSGQATVSFAPVAPPDAGEDLVVLQDRNIKPKGVITLRNKSQTTDLDLSTISFTGSVESIGSTDVSCGLATGSDLCPKNVTYGGAVGQYIRRDVTLYSCETDQAYDLGELCGNKAIWLVAYDHWVADGDFGGQEVIEGHSTTFNKYKGDGLAAVFVVGSGSEKVVVETSPGNFEASGPAPTMADCETIKNLYGLEDEVIMLYDREKETTSSTTKLVDSSSTPRMLVANQDAEIIAVLPSDTMGLDTLILEAAIEQALGGGGAVAPPDSCTLNPFQCEANTTCWPVDSTYGQWDCLPSGTGAFGDVCDNQPGAATCADEMFCLKFADEDAYCSTYCDDAKMTLTGK